MKTLWKKARVSRVGVALTFLIVLMGLLSDPIFAGELRVPGIFADHAVLQQKAPVPVWGWGKAGESVSVSVAGKGAATTVGEDGSWRVDIASMTAGGPYELAIESGEESILFKDILIGEVWFASGQSNMQWSIKNTHNYKEEMTRCENDAIRFMMIDRVHSATPYTDLPGHSPWTACSAETLNSCNNNEGFSAVSYFFAKYLQAELGVPVGMVATCWGGTRIEPWTPPVGFEKVPALAEIAALVRKNTPGSDSFNAELGAAIATVEAWLPQAKQALDSGAFPPALAAVSGASALNNHKQPTTLYNAMVHPMVPYANRGFLWYQGESNRGEGMLYRDKMEALIEGWRAVWQNPNLACYFVQLAPYDYKNNPTALAEIWEAQVATLDLPGTGMAVTNDIGNVKDIHPRNKDDVGKRLAMLALNKSYGKKEIRAESPLFDRFEVEGKTMRVYFKHAESLKTRDGAAPTWFEICGADGVFRKASAVIDGASVVLSAEKVAAPVAVHFAWDHCAEPNLMNEVGLPASAFRAGSIPVDGALKALVPEAKDLEVLYALNPTNPAVDGQRVLYDIDNRAQFAGKKIERIGYFLYLVRGEEAPEWVYAEMDPFTQNLDFIGVPVPDKQGAFQQGLENLFVKSSDKDLPCGALPEGALELWSCNYGPEATRKLKNASNEGYDFDDTMSLSTNPGYGCLQIHDVASGTTLLAFNNHRAGRDADVGIGNCAGKNSDWTFSKSASGYSTGKFLVVVKVSGE